MTNSTSSEQNPLLRRTEYIPFSAFKTEHIEPAIEALLDATGKDLERLKQAGGKRTFDSTMRALDELGGDLDFAMGLVSHIESVCTTPEWRDAYNRVLPKVSEFRSKIIFDAGLWAALKEYSETPEAKALTGVRARYLTKTLDEFRRSGADLPDDQKAELAAINTELAQITNTFSQHVLDSTNEFEWSTTDKALLAGLPDSALAMGKASAESKGKEGYRFTLQAPSYIAIMTYLDDRGVRELFYQAYNTRCVPGSLSNVELIYRILELRKKKATMLGFADFSDLVLNDRMAKNGSKAQAFVDELRRRVKTHFDADQTDLKEFALKQPGAPTSLEPWDIAYYSEKMRKAHFDFDEEELRPYFPLPLVMKGLFEIVEKVFAIRVEENAKLEKWSPDVTTYSTFDAASGALLGHFYADLHPRETKRSGAWMDSFITRATGASDGLPHVGLIAGNFTPPRDGKAALLTHDEVTTLFHEFGHLMHLLCSDTELRNQSMGGVAWDFVELPSQILENWCWEREALNLFARHFETGDRLPDALFEKLTRAKNFRSASALMRQVGFSSTDLRLHRSYDRTKDGEILPFAKQIMQDHASVPLPDYFAMIATFTHLFSSPIAYAAGYYSYQWAEVLDADAFSRFKREGIMNRSVGLEFRDKVLSRGDTKDPELLFRDFMGRDPDLTALLERASLA